MIALVWKELRENIKWALLAMVALWLAELYALYPQNGQPEFNDYILGGITICKTSFLTVTTFGCAVIGFLLGLIQILPELKRDRWASLLHRPVSRGVLFRGKVLAGLLLYATATALPFLFVIWLVATPGHFSAPFLPEMALPGTADICTGAAYYFAALAVALQRGGWIGLRVFPLLAAIHASYFVLTDKLFYVAVEASIFMALALFTAAWGEIFNQDVVRFRPWLGRLAFVAVVFYGACGLGDLTRSFVAAFEPAPYSNFERYEISDDGVPMHLTYGKGGVVITVQDLDGKPITNTKYQPDRVRNHIKYLNGFSEYIGDAHGYHGWTYQSGYREGRSYMWANYPYMYPRMEQWFYLVKQNLLMGYLPQKKVPFAFLDQHGFEPMSATPEGFPPEVKIGYAGSDAYIFWDPMRARYAFLARREMIDLALPAPAPIYGVGYAWGQTNHGSVNVTGVTLGTGLAVYDDKAALLTLLPYDQNMDRWGSLSMGVNGTLDRFYLRYDPSEWIEKKIRITMPSYLEEINLQGQVLHAYTMPPLPDSIVPRSWDAFFAQHLQSPALFFGTMIYKKIGALSGLKRLQGDLDWQFGHDGPLTREISISIALLSLLLSGITLFWARHVYFSWPRAWAWAAFVLGFNLAGFITFRLVADWPRFVSCPSCAKRRPIEAENCPNCGAGWPKPAATGIEIFDSPRSEVHAAAST